MSMVNDGFCFVGMSVVMLFYHTCISPITSAYLIGVGIA
jgi:hypothetical protein